MAKKSRKQLEKEAKARGAIIVNDETPGSGFDDGPTEGDFAMTGDKDLGFSTNTYDDQAVIDMQHRAEDARAKAVTEALQEAIDQASEENIDAVRGFRFRHQEEYRNWEAGRIMWLGDFITLLQTIRPDAFFAEMSYLGLRGIGVVGVHEVLDPQTGIPTYPNEPYYTGVSYMNGNAPEWEKVNIDSHGLPTHSIYRGWRTVLLSLIQKGIITEDQAIEVFGQASGPRSKPWHRGLWELKNGMCGECKSTVCDCKDGYDYLRADNYAYPIPDGVAKGQRQEVEPRDAAEQERRIIIP